MAQFLSFRRFLVNEQINQKINKKELSIHQSPSRFKGASTLLLGVLIGSFLYACEAKVSVSGGTEVKTTAETPTKESAAPTSAPTSAQPTSNEAIAAYNQGNAKSESGDVKGAIESYNKAISLQPSFPEAFINRGNVKAKAGDKEGAIADFNEAIHLKADSATAYASRGDLKHLSGDNAGARADLMKAAELFKQQGKAENAEAITKAIEQIK
ncbi:MULTISPECIES: tetratricopeptide repeat protein [Pseudanabaena]|uniref:Tetratricopeptide TPR_1 repeat-containing protein n=2 Tax=Pseudanabaena TaxID=1152 RepID=L8N0B1_9CYAN|nr:MULTISPECIES: tetratricopeptide repeat protein [Pseudanabaena]ELS33652.1 Tetratricopeptide TPR_1 repeat-containing protein [Pseudanabaena biceps PCC 7429]MDG3494145.1 tetratricopeptide repeat protein [Pseudanabaena catenata USMAC16]